MFLVQFPFHIQYFTIFYLNGQFNFSIEPKYSVQEYENDVPTIDTDMVCECYTQEGYRIYIYISPYAYTSYIDEDAEKAKAPEDPVATFY